jgi:sugar phosphate isomerase/epimerase
VVIRRDFLRIAGMAAGCTVGLAPLVAASAKAPRPPLGLQLFTVMSELERDFAGTLQAVAALGYKEVETIGAFGRDPVQVRQLLDRYGLRTPSQHLVPGTLYDVFKQFVARTLSFDEVKALWMEQMSLVRVRETIEEAAVRAHALGQQYIVWQIIWKDQMLDRASLDTFAAAMNLAGEVCAREGLTFNFHNHSDEFTPVDGVVPYDYILAHTDAKLVKLEMDSYWIANAGRDPVTYLRKHAGRYVQCHLKDRAKNGDFATVGKGTVNFSALLSAAKASGVKHFYVEYDRSDDPMLAVREASIYLKKWF